MKPRKLAHFSFVFFFLGFISLGLRVLQIIEGAIFAAGFFWIVSLVIGIVTLIINKRFFPNKEVLEGRDLNHLDIVGFTEAYLGILPFVLVIVFGIYYFINK